MGILVSEHADPNIRMLGESSFKPKMVALADNDRGGREIKSKLGELLERYDIPLEFLPHQGCTIEDYILAPKTLFVQAVANYLGKIAESKGDEFEQPLQESFDKT